jgi:AcrR family transcriptional regulator
MTRRPYHHGDLRAAMLQSAEAILNRDGLGALTLRAAAREAGVSHAAPPHHFGDLSGLLSELAASGFVRFRAHLVAAADAAGNDPQARLIALATAYIGFARAYPGLFQLMFRFERLDWSVAALAEAATAAFALLTTDGHYGEAGAGAALGLDGLVLAMSRWSLAHGAAMLCLDGRLDAFAAKAGADIDALIAGIANQIPQHLRPSCASTPSNAKQRDA